MMARLYRDGRWLAALGAFAFIHDVSAQFCQCSTIMTDMAQASTLASRCGTWTGDCTVQLPTTTSSPQPTTTFSLPIRGIRGSLAIFSPAPIDTIPRPPLYSLDLGTLETVEGELKFDNLSLSGPPILSDLLNTYALIFEHVSFAAGGERYTIPAYSNLSFLNCDGIRAITTIGQSFTEQAVSATFVATGNTGLSRITLSSYDTMYTDVTIRGKERNASVILSDMIGASLNIQGISFFDAPRLQYLGQEGESTSQTFNDNLISGPLALPRLVGIRNTNLEISGNYRMGSVNFSALEDISALNISDNSALTSVDLSSLTNVGNLIISGQSLTSVVISDTAVVNISGGQVHMEPEEQSACPPSTQFNGTYTCGAPSASSTSPGQSDPTEAPSHGSSGGLSTKAKIGIGVGVGVGGLLLLLGGLFLVIRSRKRNSRKPRSAGTGECSMADQKSAERSPARYSKVPAGSDSMDEPSPQSQRPISHHAMEPWAPPELDDRNLAGRTELEEQQGPRHEMDARSLPDMDLATDDEETRSLQDIERAHGHS